MNKFITMLAIGAISLFSQQMLQAQSAFDHEDQSNEYDLYDRNLDNADFNKDDYPNEQMYRDNSSGPYRAPRGPQIQTQMTQIPSTQTSPVQTQRTPQKSSNGEYNLSGSSSNNANVNMGSSMNTGNSSGSYNSYYPNNGYNQNYYPNNGYNQSYYYYNNEPYRYEATPSVETPLQEISNDRANGPLQAQNQPPQQPTNGQVAARDNEYNLYDRNRDGADWNNNDYPRSNYYPNSNYYYYNNPR